MRYWAVERTHGHDAVLYEAEQCRVDCGGLVFTNGSIFEPEVVVMVAAGEWSRCVPVDEETAAAMLEEPDE